jgi:hypothetical protein
MWDSVRHAKRGSDAAASSSTWSDVLLLLLLLLLALMPPFMPELLPPLPLRLACCFSTWHSPSSVLASPLLPLLLTSA